MQNAWWRQSKHFSLVYSVLTCPSTTTATKWAICINAFNVTYIRQIDCLRFLLAFIILLQRMPESYRQATMHDP